MASDAELGTSLRECCCRPEVALQSGQGGPGGASCKGKGPVCPQPGPAHFTHHGLCAYQCTSVPVSGVCSGPHPGCPGAGGSGGYGGLRCPRPTYRRAGMVKFGTRSLACWTIPGMLEAGSGRDVTRSQASGADHKGPWECREPEPSLGEAVGGPSARAGACGSEAGMSTSRKAVTCPGSGSGSGSGSRRPEGVASEPGHKGYGGTQQVDKPLGLWGIRNSVSKALGRAWGARRKT